MEQSAVDYNIQLLLEAKDNATKVLDNLKKEVEGLEKKIDGTKKTTEKATADMSKAFESVGNTIKALWITAIFAGAIKSISNFGKEIEPIQNAFQRLSASVWVAGDEMLEAMRKVSYGTVSDFNLMSVANKAYSLWVVSSTEEMTTLMEIARVKGQAMGRDMTDALNDIVVGLGRGSAMILDNLGIVVNQAEAQELYAQSIGKTVEQLTVAEQKQALINKVVSDAKEELKNSGDVVLTFWMRVAQLQTAWENFGARVGVVLNGALGGALDDAIDRINEFFDKIADRVEDNADNISNAIDAIYDGVVSLVSDVFDVIEGARSYINEVFSLLWELNQNYAEDTSDSLSAVKGDRTDLFYYIELGLKAVGGVIKAFGVYVVSLLDGVVQSAFDIADTFTAIWDDATSDISGFFSRLWKEVVNKAVSMVNGALQAISWMVNRVNDVLGLWWETKNRNITAPFEDVGGGTIGKLEELGNKIKNNLFTQPFEAAAKEFDSTIDGMIETYADRVGEIEKEKYKVEKTIQPPTISPRGGGDSNSNSGGWSSRGSSKSAEDNVKKMKEYYKSLDEHANKRLDNQKKVIDEVNKEYQEKFTEIQKKVEDTEKTIEGLNEDISQLKQNLVDLKIDENKSIAKEVVNARKELKALEEQYEGLREVANSVSREDLEGVGGVGKFDVDLIKKYKDYQDELNSMYDGMSESEQQALDKEIEYATWYDSLNGIEKIKEDYRIRQEEIQAELDSKINSLNQEQALLRTYKKEQNKLQDEWIARINEEYAKREKVYNALKAFEEKYMEQLQSDHFKQIEMCDKLVDKWNEVYRAKMRAMSAGDDGSRASGGPVYQGNSYLVWETGPELFVPSTNWRIVKNSDLEGNGGEISINLNMWGVVISNWSDEKEFARNIIEEIKRGLELSKKGISIY